MNNLGLFIGNLSRRTLVRRDSYSLRASESAKAFRPGGNFLKGDHMNKHELTDAEIEQLHAEWLDRKHGRDAQTFIRLANLWYYAMGELKTKEAQSGAN